MAQAYTSFVNDGVMSYARTYSRIEDDDGEIVLVNPTRSTVALKQNTAYQMCDMMQNAVAAGTGTEANFGTTAVAGKTGTTSDDKDRYFVGFTMYYVAAVWTGYDNPEKMYFSGNPACQIFRSIMSEIHVGLPYRSFPLPTETYVQQIAIPTPDVTETPEPTETPEVTETPVPTPTPTPPPMDNPDEPIYTEPVVTDAPVNPDVPDTPVVTDTPVTTPEIPMDYDDPEAAGN